MVLNVFNGILSWILLILTWKNSVDFPHLSKWPRPSRFQFVTLYHTKVTGKLQLAGTYAIIERKWQKISRKTMGN